MYHVYFNRVTINYKGCPKNGLAAVDWRLAHGLSEEPTNFAAKFDPPGFEDKLMVRALASHLDADADFVTNSATVELRPADVKKLTASLDEYHHLPDQLTDDVREILLDIAIQVTQKNQDTDEE
jgi:hypothetical protein